MVGTSCAGKTTFTRALGKTLGCPIVELDDLYWGPDWTPKPPEEFRRLVAEAAAADTWVADGNYSSVRDVLWPRATAIVWLNYGFGRVFWRGLKRTIARSVRDEALWHGNRESLRRAFLSKESILLWIVTTHRRRRLEFQALRASRAFPHLAWVEVRNPAQAERWLGSLPASLAALLRASSPDSLPASPC